MTGKKNDILQEIAREEARLRELDQTREETRARIASLRSEFDGISASAPLPLRPPPSNDRPPQTPVEKLRLFQSLFRGRTDVFPTRFENKKTGKPGYSPACSNKWEPGVCALRTGGNCGECTNQAFIPVADQVVLDHLQGRHVMGVYPLLKDETCWFLAADFDKSSWKEDVAAFNETCSTVGLPVAIDASMALRRRTTRPLRALHIR